MSREGVQRDILPIVEGSTVMTKYGPVKTDYVLFIAAGAFHMSKPSDLIPELQGRFPIRVELDDLDEGDFVRILTEPKNALTKQYAALLQTEGIDVEFTEEADSGTRLHRSGSEPAARTTSARAGCTRFWRNCLKICRSKRRRLTLESFTITPEYVREKLSGIAKDKDLSQYIL